MKKSMLLCILCFLAAYLSTHNVQAMDGQTCQNLDQVASYYKNLVALLDQRPLGSWGILPAKFLSLKQSKDGKICEILYKNVQPKLPNNTIQSLSGTIETYYNERNELVSIKQGLLLICYKQGYSLYTDKFSQIISELTKGWERSACEVLSAINYRAS